MQLNNVVDTVLIVMQLNNVVDTVLIVMQEVKAVCRVLAAILHLGNIDLAETESEHRDTVSFVTNAALLDIGEIIVK